MQLYTSKQIPLSMRHATHFIPHENAHQEILTMKISSKLIVVIGIMCPNYEHPTHISNRVWLNSVDHLLKSLQTMALHSSSR